MRRSILLPLCLVLATLAGCGNKGPLVPAPTKPASVSSKPAPASSVVKPATPAAATSSVLPAGAQS